MKKILCFSLILMILTVVSAFAQQTIVVTGTAPTVSGTGAELFNNSINDAFGSVLGRINADVSSINAKPEDLIRAFANSSVFGSHGGTTRAFAGYRFLTVSLGTAFGLQLPDNPTSIFSELSDLPDNLRNNPDGDLNFGFSPQLFNLNVGLNMSFLSRVVPVFDNLALGVRFGYINLSNMFDDFAYRNTLFGITANYQLIPQVSLAGLIVWRGVNLGTGIIFNNTSLEVSMLLDDIDTSQPIAGSPNNNYVEFVDPRVYFDMSINTVTIPLEAMTAINLFFLNIPVGVGADIAFGRNSMGVGVDSNIRIAGDLPGDLTHHTPGSLGVNAGGSMRPSVMNLKFMTGLGVTAGPVFFDMPITFYLNNGYNFGFTVGVRL